jgi:hypothetical protein
MGRTKRTIIFLITTLAAAVVAYHFTHWLIFPIVHVAGSAALIYIILQFPRHFPLPTGRKKARAA